MRLLEEKSFRFTFLGKKVYMFSRDSMGVAIEKDRGAVCVYGTTEDNGDILCAHPAASSKEIRDAEFTVRFWEDQCASVSVGGKIKIWIDFANKSISNNCNAPNFGSEAWGDNCSVPWDARMEPYF